MKKIFSAEQYEEYLEHAVSIDKLSEAELIERASLSFVSELGKYYSASWYEPYVVAGNGRNGVYALAIARLLKERGYSVSGCVIYRLGKIEPLGEKYLDQLKELGAPMREVYGELHPPKFTSRTVVIDGIFGTECRQALSGGYAALVNLINESQAPVVSIELPSGVYEMDGEGVQISCAVQATHTFTFNTPKLPCLFREYAPYIGRYTLLNLGLSREVAEPFDTDYYLPTDIDMSKALRSRSTFCTRQELGSALLVGGSHRGTGRMALAGEAVLRIGAGALTLCMPSGWEVCSTLLPEAQVLDTLGSIEAYTGVGIGALMEVSEANKQWLRQLLSTSSRPLVLEGGAIQLIARHRELEGLIPKASILMCNEEEIDTLLTRFESDAERISYVQKLATRLGVYVVLKLPCMAVCTPSGSVLFCPSGSAALTTLGSEEVLTGLVVGLLSQGYSPVSSAVLGTYLFGLSADLYAGKYGVECMRAGDIIANLPEALRRLKG